MLCYLKFLFKQKLCGEEYQYTTSPFFFVLKKTKPKKKSLTFNKGTNKNEAIKILGFKSIWSNFPNINIQLDAELLIRQGENRNSIQFTF